MRLPMRRTRRELIHPGAGSSMRRDDCRMPCFPFVWHSHPEVELTLIERGRGTRHVGDAIAPFAEGDLCLLGAWTPHTWHTLPEHGPVRSLCVQFDPARLVPEGSAPELAALRPLFARAARGLRIGGEDAARIAADLRRLFAARSEIERLGLLLAALGAIATARDAVPLASVAFAAPRAATDRAVEELVRFLHEHRREPLPQARVARRVGVSVAGFPRWFRQRFGRTYLGYVTELRIADACSALAETDRTIADIALAAGFGNLANFNRRFRAVRGTTPSAYRRAARGG